MQEEKKYLSEETLKKDIKKLEDGEMLEITFEFADEGETDE